MKVPMKVPYLPYGHVRRWLKSAASDISAAAESGPSFCIIIPEGVKPGEEFKVIAGKHVVLVTCPPNYKPGQSLRITVPIDDCDDHDLSDNQVTGTTLPAADDNNNGITSSTSIDDNSTSVINGQSPPAQPTEHTNSESTQMFEVVVPRGVKSGQPFALLAGGVRVLVTCPTNATNGQRIQFNLPAGLLNRIDGTKSKIAEIKLSYDKDGWTRTIRATDMMFQWTRLDEKGGVDGRTRFDSERSAYVLKLEYLDDGTHLRKGRVNLVTPDQGVVDSKIKGADGSDLVSYSDIASAQVKCYNDKIQWFKDTCDKLRFDWSDGHVKIDIRRDDILSDSIDAVMALSREELRKRWIFEFMGEAGLDAGGLKREWFELVTSDMMNPKYGLWQSSTNQMCMQINPTSGMCDEGHLVRFRFIGRVMGKALFDGELVNGHMVKHIYKHILGFPVLLKDLNEVDEEIYKSIMITHDMGADADALCMDFTVTEDLMGMKKTVELIPGGADIDLTGDNLPEYIEARLKYHLLGSCKAQMNELILGFYDVIPEPLLTIFDFQELELLMCGLPEIDMHDWMEHTVYSGEYDREGPTHEVCVWFWEAVSEFDEEMKARLLQFVTGTSGVPSNGFGFLQGNSGNIRKFTIESVSRKTCAFPRSHTCFNRIDLPLYQTKDELEEKLKIAITMAATGFDIE